VFNYTSQDIKKPFAPRIVRTFYTFFIDDDDFHTKIMNYFEY